MEEKIDLILDKLNKLSIKEQETYRLISELIKQQQAISEQQNKLQRSYNELLKELNKNSITLKATLCKQSKIDGIYKEGDAVVITNYKGFYKDNKYATLRGISDKGNILLTLLNDSKTKTQKQPKYLKHNRCFSQNIGNVLFELIFIFFY